MKRNIILSLLLVTLLCFGAGMGTFAWFTDSATSTGNEFTVGTFETSCSGELFSVDKAYPNYESDIKEFKVTNTGSLPMEFWSTVEWNITDKDGNDFLDTDKRFEIKPEVITNIDGNSNTLLADEWMHISSFEGWLNDEIKKYDFDEDDNFIINFQIRLNKSAGNTYKLVKLVGNLTVDAYQIDDPNNPADNDEDDGDEGNQNSEKTLISEDGNTKVELSFFQKEENNKNSIYVEGTLYGKNENGNFEPLDYRNITGWMSPVGGYYQVTTDNNGYFKEKCGILESGETLTMDLSPNYIDCQFDGITYTVE
ncbi:MAG: hypothetical protein FH751_03840 [Firmicutes bacterium]|nr:hypothetical protein [Bacillota bacterium]